MLSTNALVLSELNSSQVDLNDLPGGCQERPMIFGNLGRFELNFNILVTAQLAVLIIKYLPTTSARLELNHLTN